MGMIGDALRSAREARGVSLAKAAEDTRIANKFLAALESEAFDELPAPVYVRGFLRSYTAYLGIEAEPLLRALGSGGLPAQTSEPDSFVTGPSGPATVRPSSDPFQAPPPPARRGVVPMDEEEFVRYATSSSGHDAREPYGSTPVPGVLTERTRRYDDGGVPRGMALLALAAMLVIIIGAAAYLLATGGDDSQGGIPPNPEVSVTATIAETVIILGSPTAESSGTVDPGATQPGATAQPGETQTAGPSATGGPASTAETETSTAVPEATATPTDTPAPTPTVTAVPTPYLPARLEECTRSGQTYLCGSSPFLVVCTPAGDWFIDVGHDYTPLPAGWVATEFIELKDARTNNGCGS